MKRFVINSLTVGLVFAATIAVSSAATANQRRENQQDRIAQGVISGRLTAHETASLEGREAGLNRQIRDDRKDHNGHLTAGERMRINREQNTLSRNIYRDKHNSARQ
jgi:hypothetical protein